MGQKLAMTNLIITIALCVAVAIAYATAALIQARYAQLVVKELLRVPAFWLALGLNGLGAALHVTSLGFGPLSLIQPLGVLTLVLAVTLGAMGRRQGASTLWEATAGGLTYAVCSALCQTVVVTTSEEGGEVLLRPITILTMVAIAVFAVAATLLTQRSYRNGLAAPLAVTNLVNPASATVIGVALLGETLAKSQVEIVLAVACALVAGYGVAQLAKARDVVPMPQDTTPTDHERVEPITR
jgi:hypothetical protein